MWLTAIRAPGNAYCTWPLINVNNVNRRFPESKETQFGHMRNQLQNVRSTKKTKFELSPTIKEEIEIDEITVEKVEGNEKVEEEIKQKVIEPQQEF